jgi:Type ISP C-terminal specificity domain
VIDDDEFLRACPPDVRREFGVYFTPPEVVGAQVRLVDAVLRGRLGIEGGFADERVLVVDPACGAGAYPLAIGGARLQLYERLPAPAALARQRGLSVHEGDVLTKEPQLAAPVVVCIGNPPYRRGRRRPELVNGFAHGPIGVHLKSLYNEYVYFWRWALRRVFEVRRGAGVVCFLTAASYLRGPAFAGMRRQLRQLLDDFWVIDLEGDPRAARATGNVFPIRTPVAIGLGVRCADRSSGTSAVVHVARLGGSAEDKLRRLDSVHGTGDLKWTSADTGWTAPFVARSDSAWTMWPSLTELFPCQFSGAQVKRTWPIGITPDVLRARWHSLLQLPLTERGEAFSPTRDRSIASSPRGLTPLKDLSCDAAPVDPVRYAYRSFDRQWMLADPRLADFMRPALWGVSGPDQVFLTSMLTNVLGPGPAAVATALVPDLDHFRGSFGARGVIPLWLDGAASAPNVSTAWLERLGVRAPELMAYCYALLSAPSYTRRFGEELRTPGPHVPIATDPDVFGRCVAVGQRLLRVHTYRDITARRACIQHEIGLGFPSSYQYTDHHLRVGDGQVGPVDPGVWEYSVSGYRVLPMWLRRRIRPRARSRLDAIVPEQWTEALSRELLELIWLLEATVQLGPELDDLLEAAASPAGHKP